MARSSSDQVIGGGRSPSLKLALVALAVTFAIVVTGEVVLVVVEPIEPAWVIALFPLLGFEYAITGIVAWWRRPTNRVGAVLVLGGWFWLLAGALNTDITMCIAIGQLAAVLPFAVIVHLVLVYPSGRAGSTAARVLVAATYLTTTVFQLTLYLFGPSGDAQDPWQLVDAPALHDAAQWVQRVLGLAVVLATGVVVLRRMRPMTPAARHVLAPLALYGLLIAALIPVSASIISPLIDLDPLTLATIQLSLLALVPPAFALGVLRGGFARTGELVELGAWLGSAGPRTGVQDALAATLGDPSVEVCYWLADVGRYVNGHGRPIELPDADSRPARGVASIELDGQQLGAIIFDPIAVDDTEIVRTAGRVVGVALDRERLAVQLRSSLDELYESRARIVEAGDRERRRVARDLHDGLQAQLVLLAIRAQHLVDDASDPLAREAAIAVRRGLDRAVDELRRLVGGVMPALLVERGLAAATDELVDRMPIATTLTAHRAAPLPPSVESTAYFVIVEACANAVKHSRAARVSIGIEVVDDVLVVEVGDDGIGGAVTGTGSGLAGMADRVDALGGLFDLASPPGEGTRVRIEVPCGS